MIFRFALAAFLLGALGAWARVPGGFAWTEALLADPRTAAGFRAAVLALAGVVLWLTRALEGRGRLVPLLLLAAAAGHLFQALAVPIGSPGEPWAATLGFLVAGLALAGLWWVRRSDAAAPGEARAPLAGLGWALAGAGAAFALEVLARRHRPMTLGLPEEHGLVVAVALVLAALGARAFGLPLLARGPRLVAAVALAAVPAGALAGLAFLDTLSFDGLGAYLAGFRLTADAIGRPAGDALVGATTFVVPAFLVGVALTAAAEARALPAVLVGAALATLAAPLAFAQGTVTLGAETFPASEAAWAFVAWAAALAAVGALVALFGRSERPRGARALLATALVAAAGLAVGLGPRPAAWTFSPWYISPIEPFAVFEGAAGIGTLEYSSAGRTVATLDRRRLTPLGDELAVDQELMRAALALVEKTSARVLVVGQMTPERDALLRLRPALVVERTAPWFDLLDEFEAGLFEGAKHPPSGQRVAPGAARRRLAEGVYDLVVALPVHGPLLRPRSAAELPWGQPPAPSPPPALPAATIGVRWTDVSTPIDAHGANATLLLAGGDWRHLRLGLLSGLPPSKDVWLVSGPAVAPRSTWERSWTVPRLRGDANAERNAEWLAAGPNEGRAAAVADALATFFAAQELSSPFETPAERIELEEAVLRSLYKAVGEAGPTPFLRSTWNWLAWILAEKRRPDLALVYLERLAKTFGPWPELDRVLALAYEEFDLPEEESAAYARLLAAEEHDVTLWERAAAADLRAGDFGGAAERYRRALELAPRPELERELGLALWRDGQLEGRALLETWLEGSPEDDVVRRALTLGDFPEIERGFDPSGR
ncbi:MAG: tetratricopeptide repeat protein [Planctomycetota bacterium]